MIKRFCKAINKASLYVSVASVVVLVAIVVIVLVNVILRNFGSGIIGAYDATLVLITIVYALSLAFCDSKDGHVAIEVFVERMPKAAQKVVSFAMNAVALVIFIMVTYGIWQHALTLNRNNEVTATVHIPFTPFVIIMSIGVALLCVMLLGRLLNLFVKEGDE